MEPSDLELLRAAARGDHLAFHTLVDRHARPLFRTALSLSRTRADAEDICQETFVAAFRGLKAFSGRSSVKTWLTRILMKRAATAWARQRHARRTISLHSPAMDESGRSARGGRPGEGSLVHRLGVAASTSAVEQRMDILQVIRSLPPDLRDALVLRDVEGLKYQEIAETLGVPIGTVESRIHRARAELRQKLTGY